MVVARSFNDVQLLAYSREGDIPQGSDPPIDLFRLFGPKLDVRFVHNQLEHCILSGWGDCRYADKYLARAPKLKILVRCITLNVSTESTGDPLERLGELATLPKTAYSDQSKLTLRSNGAPLFSIRWPHHYEQFQPSLEGFSKYSKSRGIW